MFGTVQASHAHQSNHPGSNDPLPYPPMVMKTTANILFYLLATLLAIYWVVLFISTHRPVSIPEVFDHFDKLLHFSAYAMLAFALTGVITFRWGLLPRIGIWVWTTALVYGSIDEYTQKFIPDRNPDVFDLLADVLGAAVGIGCAYLTIRLVRRIWHKTPFWFQNRLKTH